MIKKIVLLLVILALASCSSSKPAIATTKKAAAVQTRTASTKRSTPAKPIGKNYPSTNNTTEVIQSNSKTVVTSDLINNYVLTNIYMIIYDKNNTPSQMVNNFMNFDSEKYSDEIIQEKENEIAKIGYCNPDTNLPFIIEFDKYEFDRQSNALLKDLYENSCYHIPLSLFWERNVNIGCLYQNNQ